MLERPFPRRTTDKSNFEQRLSARAPRANSVGLALDSHRRCWNMATGLACFAALTLLAGCYHPQYYAPPYPTYQGPVAPIQTLTPGQPYIPGQTPAGGLAPIPSNDPSLGSPGPFYDNNQPSGTSPNSTFGSGASNNSTQPDYSPPAGNDNGFVPDYLDPNTDDFMTPNVSPNDGGGVQQFKVPSGEPQAMTFPQNSAPLASTQLTVEPVPVQSTTNVSSASALPMPDADPFAVEPVADLSPVVATIEQVAFDQADPLSTTPTLPPSDQFGFEEGGYGWIRGVVNQDSSDLSWGITYDLTPGEFDDFAGHFTLATTDAVKQLQDGAFVMIEGEISAVQQDRFGKPVYEVRKITPLTPLP